MCVVNAATIIHLIYSDRKRADEKNGRNVKTRPLYRGIPICSLNHTFIETFIIINALSLIGKRIMDKLKSQLSAR